MNDLDYLSKQGYDAVPGADTDIDELTKKIQAKSKTFSFDLSVVSLVIGLVIGATLVYFINKTPKNKEVADAGKTEPVSPVKKKEISLDTFSFSEKFIRKTGKVSIESKVTTGTENKETVSAEVMTLKQVETLPQDSLKENSIQFSYNASVKYIQDLKICNYYTLYFRGGRLFPSGGEGLSADKSIKENKSESGLKQTAEIYVHEVLEEALMQYKRGEYLQSVASFKTVSSQTKNDLNCRFYTAMCYYQMQKYSQAIQLYLSCYQDECNVFKEESEFYMALCLYNSGSKEEAEKLFKKIKEEKGFYAERAGKYF